MSGDNELRGLGVSAGTAVGPIVTVVVTPPPIPELDDPVAAVAAAVMAVEAELSELAGRLRDLGRDEGAEVVAAQALMAADPMLSEAIADHLGRGVSPDDAISASSDQLQAMLRGLDDPYLAQRADDIGEVAERVRRHLAGVESVDLASFDAPVVLLADSLTAAETAQLDPATVLGFATETGGPTSHVVIIARSLGVPAVVGAVGLMDAAAASSTVALDGATGEIMLDPSDDTRVEYADRAAAHAASVEAATRFAGEAVTFGSGKVTIAANVAGQDDLDRAVAERADGIGLLRTEFLYLDRPDAPGEEEQFDFYSRAVSGFEHAVTIRTFDIGGDKPADCVTVDPEENPFLGVRGARLYASHRALFDTQVRAVLRAAALGPVQLMMPMVSTVAEIVEFRAWIDEIAAGLASDGVDHAMPQIGVMVEVPAIALVADAVMAHVDFVSIGSNDLTQYTLAADRTNGALGHLQDPLHPSVLALCMFTATAAKTAGVSSSVCGLAAADPLGAAAFAAMGIDKLSVSAPMVNSLKAAVAELDPAGGHAAVEAALAAADATEARDALRSWVER